MPDPTPDERVTRALQRAHANATRHADEAGEQLQRVTLQHRHALQALADHLAEVRALAAALAERGAETLAQESARLQARHAGLTISGPLMTGRLVSAMTDPRTTAQERAQAAQHANDVARGLPGVLSIPATTWEA